MNNHDDRRTLWPVFSALKERTPMAILKEQAAELGNSTQNMVNAEVLRLDDGPDSVIALAFNITCAPLGFSVRLFHTRYQIASSYPVEVSSIFLSESGSWVSWTAKNQGELERILQSIFSDRKTIRTVESLLAHVGSF